MRNWFWCVVRQPSTPFAEPLGEAGAQQRIPRCACGSGSDIQGPRVPSQEAAAGHLGLRSWRGWLPIPAAFCGNRKDQRAPEQSSTVGQQRASVFLTECKEVSLRRDAKFLAMAAALGCVCQLPLQGCRELPLVPMPHHPQGLKLLHLLCL